MSNLLPIEIAKLLKMILERLKWWWGWRRGDGLKALYLIHTIGRFDKCYLSIRGLLNELSC
jgi:hypothetical protein